MKSYVLLFLSFFIIQLSYSQISFNDVDYWIGSGPDSTALVIDFLDNTTDHSYVWGYLFDENDGLTASDMLLSISDSEPMLDIAIASGFLNDISFNSHLGIGGAPNYWGTWTLISDAWEMNSGISESLQDGVFFGCSYTDFSPAVEPSQPLAAYSSQSFTQNDITYWTGTGDNAAVLVIDFGEVQYGAPTRYAWGYRFNGSTTAEEMLQAIGVNDNNLNIDLSGGFLNDITYIDQVGLAGQPHYWGTFSGTNLSDWTLNTGIGEALSDGSWFGCTYEAWEPSRPHSPISATNPESLIFNDINTWLGNGPDSSVVVIDFNSGLENESLAFGYLFDGTSTAAEALETLASELVELDVNIAAGFLNDIVYSDQSGIGGNPNYWGTWSAENVGGWYLNIGVDTEINNGDWFGCSYTDWNPALPPSTPTSPLVGISSNSINSISISPNPFSTSINIQLSSIEYYHTIVVRDVIGEVVLTKILNSNPISIDMRESSSGLYLVTLYGEKGSISSKIIKR